MVASFKSLATHSLLLGYFTVSLFPCYSVLPAKAQVEQTSQEKAAQLFKKGIDLYHHDDTYYYRKGSTLDRQEESQQAFELIRQALSIYQVNKDRRGEAASLIVLSLLDETKIYERNDQVISYIQNIQNGLKIAREISDRNIEMAAISELGDLQIRLRYSGYFNVEKAIDFYEQYLKSSREYGDRLEESIALFKLGYVYKCLAAKLCQIQKPLKVDYNSKANEFFYASAAIQKEIDSSIEEYQSSADKKANSFFQRELWKLKGRSKRFWAEVGVSPKPFSTFTEVEQGYRQDLFLNRISGDLKGEAYTLLKIGNLYRLRFRHTQAVKLIRQALEIYQKIGDRRGELNTLCGSDLDLGGSTGRLLQGKSYEEEGLIIYLARRDPQTDYYDHFLKLQLDKICPKTGDILHILLTIYNDQGHYKRLVSVYPKLIKIYRQLLRDDYFYTKTYLTAFIELGIAYKKIGQHKEASAVFQRSSFALNQLLSGKPVSIDGIRIPPHKKLSHIQNYVTIAVVQNNSEAIEKALYYVKKNYKNIYYPLPYNNSIYHFLSMVGSVYERFGQYDRAISYYQKALSLSDLGIDYLENLEILDRIGGSYFKQQKYTQALNAFSLASKTFLRENRIHRGIDRGNLLSENVHSLIGIGKTYAIMGNQQKAREFFRRANIVLNQAIVYTSSGGRGAGVSIPSVLSDEDDLDKLSDSISKSNTKN